MPAIQTQNSDFAHSKAPTQRHPVERWEMHVGVHKLYIVGPGHGSMWAVTEPCYRGQVGTDEERRIVRNAVVILSREQRDNSEATREIIMDAMRRAAKGPVDIEDNDPEPEPEPEPQPPKQLHRRLLVGYWEKRWKRRKNSFVHRDTVLIAKTTEERNAIDLAAGEIRYATAEDNSKCGDYRRGKRGQWKGAAA